MGAEARVRIARDAEVPRLPEIELAAAALFEGVPVEVGMPDEVSSLEDLREALEAGRLWVAEGPDGTPVGFAHVEMLGGEPHLEEVDVHPDHGRRGLGAALVTAVCEWAEAQGFPRVTLTTYRDVAWNQPFYERLGFRAVDADRLTPALRERVREEDARGLRREQRLVMRFATKAGA